MVEVPLGVQQHDGAHHFIVLMGEDMTVVHESRELNQLLFRDFEVGVDGDGRVVVSGGPADSQDKDSELGHKGSVLPPPLMLLNIISGILT